MTGESEAKLLLFIAIPIISLTLLTAGLVGISDMIKNKTVRQKLDRAEADKLDYLRQIDQLTTQKLLLHSQLHEKQKKVLKLEKDILKLKTKGN